MLQLPNRNDYCVKKLLYLRVSCLSILQDVADKVYQLLLCFCSDIKPLNDVDCADNCIIGGNVH
jgi:hypothetical protein